MAAGLTRPAPLLTLRQSENCRAAGGCALLDFLVGMNGGEHVAVLRAAEDEPPRLLLSQADRYLELEEHMVAILTDVGHRPGPSIDRVGSSGHVDLLATTVPS